MKRSHLAGVLSALVLAYQGSPLAVQGIPGRSLLIQSTEVVDRHLVLTLQNADTQIITAWGVRGQVTFDGGGTQLVDVVADGYSSGFYDTSGKPVLLVPRATVRTRLGVRLRDAVISSVAVTPVAVVFSDGKAAGGEDAIKRIFDLRAREYRACQVIDAVMSRHVGLTTDALTAVSLIERELEDVADDEIRGSRPYRTLRQNLSIALAPSGRADLAQRLSQLHRDMRAFLAAANANYRRR